VAREITADGAGAPELIDGSTETLDIDPKRLVDDDGRRIRVRASVVVDEGAPEVATSSVLVEREADPVLLTDDEREERFLRHHDPAELESFWERVQAGATLVDPATGIAVEVAAWADTAPATELERVRIQLRDIPALERPPLRFDPLASGPSFDEAGSAARVEAELAHREEVGQLVDGFVAAVALEEVWRDERFGMVDLLLPAGEVDAFAARDDVLALAFPMETIPFSNAGGEEQHEFQVAMLLDHGYDGGQPSGMVSGAAGMRALIYDVALEQDHPAMVQRLDSWYKFDGQFIQPTQPTDVGQTASGGSHGTGVTTALAANGFEDTNYGSQTALDRSGMAMEAEIRFIDRRDVIPPNDGPATLKDVLDWMPNNGNADLLQHSYGTGGPLCTHGNSPGVSNPGSRWVNDFYLQDIFVSQAAGNNGSYGPSCTVGVPAMAAGAFTAGAVQGAAVPLTSAPLHTGASRGGDVHGRAVIDLAASWRREDWTMDFDDVYHSVMSGGTSYASPLIGGAALNVKDMLVSHFGSGVANEVGNLYATMLLMGDDQKATETAGPFLYYPASSTDPSADPRFGFGRLATRSLDAAGLDAPARFQLERFVLADGQQQTVFANPSGWFPVSNLLVPAAVDRLEAVVWWYEPNLECPPWAGGCTAPAEISVELCNGTGTCYDSDTMAPGPRRVVVDNPGGQVWTLKVDGVSIPASTDVGYHHGLQERTMHVAMMWEDRARDDVDGPTCIDDVDYDCATCCTATGQCVPSDCS